MSNQDPKYCECNGSRGAHVTGCPTLSKTRKIDPEEFTSTGDPVLYEGPLPLLSGIYRLTKSGDNYFRLHYQKLWNGNPDGWNWASLSAEYNHIHQYAFIEALKLALNKATK